MVLRIMGEPTTYCTGPHRPNPHSQIILHSQRYKMRGMNIMATFIWKNPVDGVWNDLNARDAGISGARDTVVLNLCSYTVTSTQSNGIACLVLAPGVVLAIADNTSFS